MQQTSAGRGAVFALLAVFAAAAGFSRFRNGSNYPDRLDKIARQMAGKSAIDCGRGVWNPVNNTGREAADACAIAAHEAHKSFYVRYGNSTMWRAVVRTPDGLYYFVSFQPGSFFHRGVISIDKPVRNPKIIVVDGKPRIASYRDLVVKF